GLPGIFFAKVPGAPQPRAARLLFSPGATAPAALLEAAPDLGCAGPHGGGSAVRAVPVPAVPQRVQEEDVHGGDVLPTGEECAGRRYVWDGQGGEGGVDQAAVNSATTGCNPTATSDHTTTSSYNNPAATSNTAAISRKAATTSDNTTTIRGEATTSNNTTTTGGKPPPPATTSPPSAAKPPPPATTPQPSAAKPPPPATTPPPSAAKPPPPATTPPSVAKTPPPATTPPPSAAKAPPAATTPPPSAAKPPPAATTPPPSAAKPPPPAKSPPASAEKTEAKAKPAKKEAPVPDKPKAEAGTKAETKASSKDEEKKGFGWLLNRNKAAAAPALAELLKEEDAEAKFYRAVASELCVDTPGIFDGTEGLTAVPSSVPMATRATLLHAAVKAEAEKLAPKEAAEGTVCVAKSMVREMVEKAADIKEDSKAKREALDKVVLLAHSSQSLATALAPNVEAGVPVYEGSLRYKTLESLFDLYLDNAVEDMQQSTAAMFGSLMGGEDASNKTMAELTARAEQAEKAQNTLAGIFKISEGKAQKLLERKMKAATDQAQKDMMSGLMGGNS
ncbi:unnamed protein product, partial [Effrenium voratum]